MIELANFVDKIYCINLKAREDRWEQVLQQFKKIGIIDFVTRIPAIFDKDPRKGCLESHHKCIRDAVEKRLERILIFEDDVHFLNYDNTIFNNVVSFLKKNKKWDLFYLGGNVMYPAHYLHPHVFRSRFFSTHAYVIHQRFYEKAMTAKVPIDKWYALNSTAYGLDPLYVVQCETYSDIRQKVVENFERTFQKKYDLLVHPPAWQRWINYFITHYLVNWRFF